MLKCNEIARRKMTYLALLAGVFFVPVVGHAQYAATVPPAEGLLGYWSTNGGAVLHIDACGSGVCITVVTISQKAPGVVDGHNPDPALRTRPVCKMEIGSGFDLKDANHGEHGRIYDPESGKTYKAAIVSNGNNLSLRGYVGVKALGRNQSWQRTSAESATCVGTTYR